MGETKTLVDNSLATTIRNVADHPQYDASVKKIFRDRHVLAHILKDLGPDFKDLPYEVLAESIGNPLSVPVEPHINRETVVGLATESIEEGEGTLHFDVRFNMTLPNRTENRVEVHVDIEGQGTIYPSYHLPKRMAYYISRMISEQIPSLNDPQNYNLIQPSYSIWICYNNVPKRSKGTIETYALKYDKDHSFGNPMYSEDDFDYLRIVVVTVPDDEVEGQHTLNVLRALLGEGMDADTRIRELRNLNVPVDAEVERSVTDMTAYIEGIGNKRYEEGKAEGKAEMIRTAFENGATIEQLVKVFGFTNEEVKKALSQKNLIQEKQN